MDGAAKQFTEAYDAGLIPMEMVNSMRKKGQLIMGIGHRVKSVSFFDGPALWLKKRLNLTWSCAGLFSVKVF